MKKLVLAFLIAATVAIVLAAPSVTELKAPAAAGGEAPNLAVAPDGRVFLSWLEPISAKAYALKFSVREKAGWSAPQTIASGPNWFVSGADYPTIAFLPDGTMAAAWFVATNLEREAYNTRIVLSRDYGKTWGIPFAPHRDTKQRQHGFVSFVPTPDGKFGVIWLDGRKMNENGEGDMGLMFTTVGKDGKVGAETVLDGRVCECCQTSAAAVPDGLLVVFRDRSAKEIRDISITRFTGGRWSPSQPLSTEGWEYFGCPVNGPAVSSNGRNVAAAWFTEVKEKPQVNVALSADGGKTFGKPVKVDDGKPSGRLDIVSLASGAAVVSWVEIAGQRSQVRLRQVEANGVARPAVTVSGTTGVQPGAVPRIERAGNEFIVAWTASGDRPSVHTAIVNLQ